MPERPERRPTRLERCDLLRLALLAAAVFAAYANSLGNGFVWDDEHIIVGNPRTRDLARLPEVLVSADEVRPYYRPLNRASYLVAHRLFGMDPRGFHAVNLALHAGCALALYVLARRLRLGPDAAAVTGALGGLHPVLTEAVNFLSARNNLFALLFVLLATLFALRAGETGRWRWAWASGAAFFLGLASKEPALMALVPLALLAWRPPRGRGVASLARFAPHALALFAYALLRVVALRDAPAGEAAAGGPFSTFVQSAYAVPAWLGLFAWPAELTNLRELPADWAGRPWLLPAWIAIAAAVWAVLGTRHPVARFGLAWFGAFLLPVAQVVPIPSAPLAERYLYLPAAGLFLTAGALVEPLLARGSRARRIAGPLVLAVLLALGVRTAARNADWRSDETLFRSAVEADPRSVEARFNLGVALKDAGDLAGAAKEWEAALGVHPGHAPTLAQLGTLRAVAGDLRGAEELYRRALAARPALAMARVNLGLVCERTGRREEAGGHYRAVLAQQPPAPAEYAALARARLAGLGAR